MENLFTAYTKDVNNQTLYFVKKYIQFPEYNAKVPILDSYGMHTDFYKACFIANITDEAVVNNLMKQLNIEPEEARVIPLHKKVSITHSLFRNTQQAILKLRLAGINH